MEYKLVATTLFKNNAPYLAEWVEFHLGLGVEKFVLYNHDSTDHYLDVLSPYIAQNIVELRYASSIFPTACRVSTPPGLHEFVKCQLACLKHFYFDYFYRTEWYIFFDTDEFIFPAPGFLGPNWTDGLAAATGGGLLDGMSEDTTEGVGAGVVVPLIPTLLDVHFTGVDLVTIEFTVFGSSNVSLKVGDQWFEGQPLVTESFLAHGPSLNTHPQFGASNSGYKQLARAGALLDHIGTPHMRGCGALCTHSLLLKGPTAVLRGNHYQYKSRADMEAKAYLNGNPTLLLELELASEIDSGVEQSQAQSQPDDVLRNNFLTSVPGDNGVGIWGGERLKRRLRQRFSTAADEDRDICPAATVLQQYADMLSRISSDRVISTAEATGEAPHFVTVLLTDSVATQFLSYTVHRLQLLPDTIVSSESLCTAEPAIAGVAELVERCSELLTTIGISSGTQGRVGASLGGDPFVDVSETVVCLYRDHVPLDYRAINGGVEWAWSVRSENLRLISTNNISSDADAIVDIMVRLSCVLGADNYDSELAAAKLVRLLIQAKALQLTSLSATPGAIDNIYTVGRHQTRDESAIEGEEVKVTSRFLYEEAVNRHQRCSLIQLTSPL